MSLTCSHGQERFTKEDITLSKLKAYLNLVNLAKEM